MEVLVDMTRPVDCKRPFHRAAIHNKYSCVLYNRSMKYNPIKIPNSISRVKPLLTKPRVLTKPFYHSGNFSFFVTHMRTRPGVAGAVLQTPLF